MNKLKLGLLAACMGLATTASAQFVNASSDAMTPQRSNSNFDIKAVKTSGWNRIYFSYNPSNLKYDDGDYDDNTKYQGFTVGWLNGFSLTKKVPLYMEAGVGIQYRGYKDSDSDYDYESTYKESLMSLNIPVNVLYRFNIVDDFSISPYFGLDFRLNLLGKGKYEEEYDGDSDSETINLFDEDDMGKDLVYKRFQAGWHIGVGFDYRALHFGVDYGTDFSEICEDCHFGTTSVTLGVNF